MERRKFLIGAGSAAVGASALIGSGAFTSVQAERDFNVEVVGDEDALLGIAPYDGPNGQYASEENGLVEVDFTSNDEAEETGLNDRARTNIENVLEITNNGTQDVLVNVALEDSDGNVGGDVANGLEVGISGDDDTDFARLGPDYDGDELEVGESAGLGFFFNYDGSPQEDFGDVVDDIEKMWIVAAADSDVLGDIEDSLTT